MVNMAKDSGMPKPLPQSLVPSRSGSTHKLAANIKVVVRVRPFNQREFEQNNRIIIDVIDDRMLVFDPKEMMQPFYYHGVQQPNKNFLKRANKELKFVFDHVCGLNATNQDVFETATKDILASLMEGYNCSVFVYGATGAGKTFTMIGNKENPGITYLTMDHLFETIHGFEMEREFVIDVSYMEVYNENVYDLLKPSGTPLQLREDAKYGVVVAGLTYHSINTARELLDMLENGNKNRTQHPTDANAESSRSHAIFQVYLKMRCKTSSRCSIVKLSMIDLAGSERASATGCIGERFKEGANINRSLLSLGNCINKLADGGSYIPYRDSKLTRILKDSLGGNCKTVMIANVSPSSLSYEDTYNTLKYAARANKIQMSLKKNIVGSDMKLSQCLKLVKDLEKKAEESDRTIKELRAKLALTAAVKEPVVVNNKGKQDNWIQRINEAECAHSALESNLLTLMSQQRILALRHFLRTRAFSHVADLAYRSSSDALEQICTEEIPRQERAAESYLKRCAYTASKIKNVWTKWRESSQRLQALLKQAIADCPDLIHFVDKIKLQAEQRLSIATNDLRHKVSAIMNEEILVSTDCMSDAYNMLKKLYLILKGNDMVPPVLTDEYLEIINKAKSAKVIHWSDETVKSNPHFEYITSLDLENPTQKPDSEQAVSENINVTIDVNTDSDITDVENCNPELSAKKRKGTPIKLANNETIIIDDSMEALDTTRNLNSAKKYKRDPNPSVDIENFVSINPQDLNSTFVLAGKMAALKKEPKIEAKTLPVKRGLTDSTNIIHRTVSFNNDNKARIVKPVIPMRRVAVAAPVPRGPAFGSSVARDGSTLPRTVQGGTKKTVIQNSVGFKAIHARDRPNTHPYSRPALSNAMRRPELTRK